MYRDYIAELKSLHCEASQVSHVRLQDWEEAAWVPKRLHQLELERRDLMRQAAREIGMVWGSERKTRARYASNA